MNNRGTPTKPRNIEPRKLTALASVISAILGAGSATNLAQAQQLEEVTVTGSRILRRDLTSSSPIMTVESAQFEQSSTLGIESVLNSLPQFVPANTQFDTASTEPSGFSTPGIASLNLRGLGPNRNLVLINGRRAQPANALLIVDVNTIPAAAIERVETITGGASAVYGADALAGVVNFILKRDFEGVEVDFQSGMTAEGDGEETKLSSLIGMNSSDGRGNVLFGVDWTKREAVHDRDRDWRTAGWSDPGTITGGFLQMPGYRANVNPPSQEAVDLIFARYGAAPGQVPRTTEFYFNPDNTAFILGQNGLGYSGPLQQMDSDGRGYSGVSFGPNGLQQTFVEGNISSPLERRTAFGRGIMDMTDNVSLFVQANYSAVDVNQVSAFAPAITVWQAEVPFDDREIPNDLQALLESRDDPTAPWNLFRGLDFLGTERARNQTDMYQVMAGIEGEFPGNDWTYDAFVSTGRTSNLYLGAGTASLGRYRALVAAADWGQAGAGAGAFAITCGTGLPIFGGPAPSADCIEGIEAKLKILTQVEQDIAEANLQGKIVDMPAGELRFAVGASQRKNTFLFEPSEINDNVSIIDQPIGMQASNNTAGEQSLSEVYGELLVPVTQALELEFGYRYSDSDVTGSADTWKALFSWSPSDSVRLRGGFQFATRSPNVAELFIGPSVQVVGFAPSDPCTFTTLAPWGNRADNPRRDEVQALCRALIGNNTSDWDTSPEGPDGFARPGLPFFPLERAFVQGNPNLKPEEASTWTLGVVLDGVGSLENLVTSFDVYNIEIEEAIAPVDAVFVYAQCFNANGTSNPDLVLDDPGGFCSLITREETTGLRAAVDTPYFNSGILNTRGLDVTVNWSADIGPGSFNVNSVTSILDHFKTQDNPIAPVFDAAGTLDQGGQFDYRLLTTASYAFGDTVLGLQWRHLPSIKDQTAAQDPDTRIRGVASYDLFNLFVRQGISDQIEFRAGIDNLLDKDPPVVGADPGTADLPMNNNLGTTVPGFYDPLGRRYYLAFNMSF